MEGETRYTQSRSSAESDEYKRKVVVSIITGRMGVRGVIVTPGVEGEVNAVSRIQVGDIK